MLSKYSYYKAFGSGKEYDEEYADEADALLIIHSVMNEMENKLIELSAPKR